MYDITENICGSNCIFNNFTKQEILPYTIGALLYSPAVNDKIADMILEKKIISPYSLALCLEDSISDTAVEYAEQQIVNTFYKLYKMYSSGGLLHKDIPKLFIRIRRPEQVTDLFYRLKPYQELLTGFIFPKYSLHCSSEYNETIKIINGSSSHTIYIMPIIESEDIINLKSRREHLAQLKSELDCYSDYVLNIRVGGNDFCKGFGIRRHADETIYEVLAVSNILSDIITEFSRDYVVSAPVWEYFSGQEWECGLKKELRYDKLNGFIGKTVIHPNQIPVVNESLKVSKKDFDDAIAIMGFQHELLQVAKSSSQERMNEIKTHSSWAEKTLLMSSIYGVKNDEL